MAHATPRTAVVLTSLLMVAGMAAGQTQHDGLTFSVQDHPAEAPIVQVQGRTLVDLQDLARLTNGSLSFEKNRIVLSMPHCDSSNAPGEDTGKTGFSRGFRRAAIEASASIREWGGMLMITVQNGYPVGNAMAGNTVMAYEGRAADNVSLASSAASSDSDARGLELLRNEFNNVQAWADRFIKARNSLSAANLTTSENALKDDEEVQKLVHCGQFLAQMFAGATFQDDEACRPMINQ